MHFYPIVFTCIVVIVIVLIGAALLQKFVTLHIDSVDKV